MSRAPRPRPATSLRINYPFCRIWVGSDGSLPAEGLEDVLLNAQDLLVREAGIGYPVPRARPGAAQAQDLVTALHDGLIEAEPPAPHQQQGDDVAEADACGFVLSFQPLEAVQQQFVVNRRSALAFVDRHLAGPE